MDRRSLIAAGVAAAGAAAWSVARAQDTTQSSLPPAQPRPAGAAPPALRSPAVVRSGGSAAAQLPARLSGQHPGPDLFARRDRQFRLRLPRRHRRIGGRGGRAHLQGQRPAHGLYLRRGGLGGLHRRRPLRPRPALHEEQEAGSGLLARPVGGLRLGRQRLALLHPLLQSSVSGDDLPALPGRGGHRLSDRGPRGGTTSAPTASPWPRSGPAWACAWAPTSATSPTAAPAAGFRSSRRALTRPRLR